MAITKESIAKIHADIDAALKAVAEKHNLSIAPTRISYSTTGFKFTGEFGDKSSLGDVNPVFFKDMKRGGWIFGLNVEDIGKDVKIGARTYKIEGMKGKYVIGKLSTDGKLYKLRGEDVAACMNKKSPVQAVTLTEVPAPSLRK